MSVALENLRNHQEQADMDGCMVKVSRQVIEETLAEYDQMRDEIERLRKERDELYGYVNGLLGLLQLVRGRDDMPDEISEALRTSHRTCDAAAIRELKAK